MSVAQGVVCVSVTVDLASARDIFGVLTCSATKDARQSEECLKVSVGQGTFFYYLSLFPQTRDSKRAIAAASDDGTADVARHHGRRCS